MWLREPTRFAAFHEALMRAPGRLDEAAILRAAADAGVDPDELTLNIADPSIDRTIAETAALAREIWITGTPGFIIGDAIVPGHVDAAEVLRLVAEARRSCVSCRSVELGPHGLAVSDHQNHTADAASAPTTSVPVTPRGAYSPDQMQSPPAGGAETAMPMVVYILYLVGLITGLAAVVGVILAHANRGKAWGTWIESHYTFQIRTFWIGLLFVCIGGALATIGAGFLVLLGFLVWAGVRSVAGLNLLKRGEPIPNPQTWVW